MVAAMAVDVPVLVTDLVVPVSPSMRAVMAMVAMPRVIVADRLGQNRLKVVRRDQDALPHARQAGQPKTAPGDPGCGFFISGDDKQTIRSQQNRDRRRYP